MTRLLAGTLPIGGCDRCWCGCKYWTTDGVCIDCGTRFTLDMRIEDE
jgi:hypothetical protein